MEIWPWVKVNDASLGHWKQLCEILSRSNLAVRSYCPDTDFGYVCTVTLKLEIWPWVKVMTHLWVMDNMCEISSRSNLAVRNYGPDTDFRYMCTVTLTLEIWLWVKVMTHPWVVDNNCVKYYQDPTWKWGAMAWTWILGVHCDLDLMDFWYMCTVTLTLEIWLKVKVMTHPWVVDNNCVKYYPDPTWKWGTIARTRIFGTCVLWPWPWRYDLKSKSWHTLGSWTTIVWNII